VREESEALYTPLYMSMPPKVRTQIYVTAEQRRRGDEIARREDKAMAEVIREAIDAFLLGVPADPSRALDATFGVTPDLMVPSRDEWDRHG
jgi:predicted DNA-binding protein